MSHFLSDLVICPQEDGINWKVCTPFDYEVGDVGSGDKIRVPEGFMTDLGSVPQIFWNLIPPIGKPLRGYVLHDWLYAKQDRSRAKCDGVLLEAMEVAGVFLAKRWTIYLGVRAGGWLAWREHIKNGDPQRIAEGERPKVAVPKPETSDSTSANSL